MTSLHDIAEAVIQLQEAAEQVAKWRRLNPAIAIIRKAMAKAFRKQGDIVLSEMKRYKDTFPTVEEAMTPGEFDRIVSASFQGTDTAMLEAIENGTSTAMLTGADSTIAGAEAVISFNLKNPRAVSWVQANAAEAVTGINQTTKLEMGRILTTATDQGWSYNKTAKAIRTEFDGFAFKKPQLHIRDRATLVAVDQSAHAYEEGSRMAVDDMTAAGLTMEKHWLNVGDDRVSDGCNQNSGAGWISHNSGFPSGHQNPPRFPGCRCTAQYRRVSGQIAPEEVPVSPLPTGKAWAKQLNANESAAIRKWQGETCKRLRTASKTGAGTQADLQTLQLLDQALAKSAPYKGTVYRGLNLKPTALKTLENAKTLTWDAVSSASRDPRVAARFAGTGDRGVVFRIKNKTGVSISEGGTDLWKIEQEVTMRKGTQYRVTRTEWGDFQGRKNILQMHLEEI